MWVDRAELVLEAERLVGATWLPAMIQLWIGTIESPAEQGAAEEQFRAANQDGMRACLGRLPSSYRSTQIEHVQALVIL